MITNGQLFGIVFAGFAGALVTSDVPSVAVRLCALLIALLAGGMFALGCDRKD